MRTIGAHPMVDGIEKRRRDFGRGDGKRHGHDARRDGGARVERHDGAEKRYGRAVEVEGAHAPIERCTPQEIGSEEEERRVVAARIDFIGAPGGFGGRRIGIANGRLFAEEFDLVVRGVDVLLPRENGGEGQGMQHGRLRYGAKRRLGIERFVTFDDGRPKDQRDDECGNEKLQAAKVMQAIPLLAFLAVLVQFS